MPYKKGQVTLIDFLGIVPVKKVAKTRVLGGPYIRTYDLFVVISFVYECAALLGRARSNRADVLEKMLTGPGVTEGTFIQYVRTLAKKRLDAFRSEAGKEPDTFFEFIQARELEKATGVRLHYFLKADFRVDRKIMKTFDAKWSVEDFQPLIWQFGNEGIGFGLSFPELTEKMYRNAYEHINSALWSEAREAGLSISEEPTIVSLEERQDAVLQMVAAYTSEYYPELLALLDLRLK